MSDTNKNQIDSQEKGTNSFDQLVIEINTNINALFPDLISSLLNSAQDKLFNISNEADNNEIQTRYFELMNQVRTLKGSITADFCNNVKEYLLPADEFEQKHNSQQSSNEDELSLVGQNDMESLVLVKGVGERAAGKYMEQLSQLELRLKELSQKTNIIFKSDALDPTNFCQAFDDALTDVFDNSNKKILFGMFDAQVANKLDDLYDSTNKLLIDAGILPKIQLHISNVSSSSTPSAIASSDTIEDEQHTSTSHHTSENPGAQNTGNNNISGFAMTAAPGSNYRNSPQNTAQSSGNGQAGNNTGSYADAGNRTNSGNTEYQHYTAGMPANQVGQTLSNFIGAPFSPDADNKPSTENKAFYPQSTSQHFGHQEIIQALSSIQTQPEFDQTDGNRIDGDAIKQAVMSAIAKTSGGAVTKRINQIAEKTIDFIELIFDAIIDDKEISDTIKTLLLRMQIPIIKASMSDREFFIYDDHPARVLLDTIADACVGIIEHTDDIYIFLDKTITNILSEYELNTEIYQHALDDLNTYLAEKEEETKLKEAEEQQQILRKHARATVLKSLRATTTGKTLPEEVHALILKRWPTLMFNHYLRNGKENDEWVNIVLTLRDIVDSVQVIISADHLAKILSKKDALFERTENYLNASSNSKKDVQNVMAVYKETVQKHIDDANFTDEEVTVADAAISDAEPVEELPVEEEVIDRPTIPSNIMPGMWFQIFMGKDKAIRRCKLSVILVEDANLMFVNHKGELVVEKSFDEFNEEIANDTTKIIMGQSAFENAFKTVINRLN